VKGRSPQVAINAAVLSSAQYGASSIRISRFGCGRTRQSLVVEKSWEVVGVTRAGGDDQVDTERCYGADESSQGADAE
jgi:hypothetical protein